MTFKFDTTNSKPIIAQFGTPGGHGTRPGRVVLVKKEHNIGEYVVAWQGVDLATGKWDVGWHHGEYVGDFDQALEAFHQRAKRDAKLKSIIGFVDIPSQLYICTQCRLAQPPGNPMFEILVSLGTKCQECESTAHEDGWRPRTSVEAMSEAVGS